MGGGVSAFLMPSYRRRNQARGRSLPFLGSLEVRCVWHAAPLAFPLRDDAGWGCIRSPHLLLTALHRHLGCLGWGWASAPLLSQPGVLCAHTVHSLLWVPGAEPPGEAVSACPEPGLQVGAGYTHPFFLNTEVSYPYCTARIWIR